MVNAEILRNWIPERHVFFTANLLERKRDFLVTEIEFLRDSECRVKYLYPF